MNIDERPSIIGFGDERIDIRRYDPETPVAKCFGLAKKFYGLKDELKPLGTL